jgi:hypothetical protein
MDTNICQIFLHFRFQKYHHINHNFEIQKFCLKQYVQLYVLDYNEFYYYFVRCVKHLKK